MNFQVRFPLALGACILWIGFVGAISFMEAWLKFRAPGINLSLGLGIGRLVFAALNKVEWVLALAALLNLVFAQTSRKGATVLLFATALLLLVLQTFYVLPALDHRAELQIRGQQLPPSSLHLVYVGLECTKVICLLVFVLSLFRPLRSGELSSSIQF